MRGAEPGERFLDLQPGGDRWRAPVRGGQRPHVDLLVPVCPRLAGLRLCAHRPVLCYSGTRLQECLAGIVAGLSRVTACRRLAQAAVTPPSMAKFVPVTQRDSSDARYTAHQATSSGSP